jgi:hypothetical protein
MEITKQSLLEKCEKLGITKCKSKTKQELVKLIEDKEKKEEKKEENVSNKQEKRRIKKEKR